MGHLVTLFLSLGSPSHAVFERSTVSQPGRTVWFCQSKDPSHLGARLVTQLPLFYIEESEVVSDVLQFGAYRIHPSWKQGEKVAHNGSNKLANC